MKNFDRIIRMDRMPPEPNHPGEDFPPPAMKSRRMARMFLLAAGYFAGGYLGLLLPMVGSQITLFWPPTGIAVAALLRWGMGVWPGIALGALLVNLAVNPDLPLALGISLGNTLGPLAACGLLHRLRFSPGLEERRDILLLVLAGAMLPMLLTASGGCAALLLAGALTPEKLPFAWMNWWWGDVLGVLLFAPPLLSYTPELWRSWRIADQQRRDALLALSLLLLSSLLVFFRSALLHLPEQLLGLPLLFLIWLAAIRSIWCTSVAALLSGLIAILSTALGHGPFHTGDLHSDLLWLWVFVACLAVMGLFVAAMSANYRLAQQRLRESEEKYRILADYTYDWEYWETPDGRCRFVSPSCERVTGYKQEELLADPRLMETMILPEDLACWQEHRGFIRNGIEVHDAMFRIRRRDGDVRWIEHVCNPVADSAGRPLGRRGSNRDVTERKLAEAALAASESRLAEAQHIARIGSWELDHGNGRLLCSEEVYRIFELTSAKLHTGYEWFLSAVHPEDIEPVLRAWLDALEHRTPYSINHRLQMADGRIKHVAEQCETRFDQAGQPLRSMGTVQDITALKTAQLELEQYRLRLEDLVAERTADLDATNRRLKETQFAMDRAGIAIHWLDADSGRFLYVNGQACEMLGYSREEMLGMTVSDIDPNFPKDSFRERTAPFREQGHVRFETVKRRKDGSLLPVEVTVYHQPPEAGHGGRLISFATDIRRRKAAELELVQAKEAAESANRAKSVFLANMSHELRTPLNAILGFAQLMERDPELGAQHRRELATINRSGRHLLELINDVLEISRIEAGRTSIHNEAFDLAEMLQAIEDMIRVRAEAKGLAFATKLQGVLHPWVWGDVHHIRQVLINLLGNAVKYTGQGRITLCLYPVDGHIRFEVADTGPGIAVEDQPLVFHAFYQTAFGIAKGEGTGLGLTISREFVRLMGGELTLASEPGQGCVFGFTLPLPEAEAPADTAAHGRILGLEAGQAGILVLVAEDDADSRELLIRLMEIEGFDVRAVENGRQALASFLDERPDFIWMDMRMPEMDGYEATRRIRALPGGDRVRIVALTASAFREDRDAILAAGCDEMVSKPLEEDRLFRVMGKLLNLPLRHAELPVVSDRLPESGIDFAALPPALRAELKNAAERLDQEEVRAIVERIREEHPEAARTIAEWTDRFRFDELIAWCERT